MRPDRAVAAYRIAILTLDAHAAGPVARAEAALQGDFPGLSLEVFAAAEWGGNPAALHAAREGIGRADMIVTSLLFLEEHVEAILPALRARRPEADAVVGMISDRAVVELTKMGGLDMAKPVSGTMKLLKRLRGSGKPSGDSGARQMRMLRRLPKLLRLVPGKAQDLRAWFLSMQYWLGGSEENVEAMVRNLVGRYGPKDWQGGTAPAPIEYPELGLWHPDVGVTARAGNLPAPARPVATVGLLMLRSYVLAGDTGHYAAVIRALEARGLRCVPAFAGGLDGRPAIDAYHGGVDALLSLTGFSLVGGPAYNDSEAAVETLRRLDVPYLAAHPLEFQTLAQWEGSAQGLGPVETTMLVALPELDGAACPTVFAGRNGERAMAPHPERVEALAGKVARLAALRRKANAGKKVAVVLYGFPPNAGAVGTAAYLSVFESLWNTLARMKADGYEVDLPEDVDALREAVLSGGEAQGQPAAIADRVTADAMVRGNPWLAEVEAAWGPAPGRHQSDGAGVFVLGTRFGDVFVGVQPVFGTEGDPMRLLFEKGFAPTHAFVAFYRWLAEDFGADAVLHFGMHGALEFMPGKQVGMSGDCWPDRLIGDLPNVYLYAANNPSEASLAKRRSNAVTVTHLTPPLAKAGLWKGLAELKDSLARFRAEAEPPEGLRDLIRDQAAAVDLAGEPEDLWRTLAETEESLITDGFHVLGRTPSEAQVAATLAEMDAPSEDTAALLTGTHEMDGLMRALSARYVPPVPGGDLVRSPAILPAGRNIHAFDPFRMPTAWAMEEGRRQADLLLAAHHGLPRAVALVLWGSDNIKSDGQPIAQALALMGAMPRFDAFGRLSGADLIPLEELGRPRVDVMMTLSGIFRDLLPLQTRMLAEAAWKCATADEPEEANPIRAHALAHAEATGCDLEEAALRVFSNAEGAYGANVNLMIDAGAWEGEDELADAYQARKGFAYGRDGKAAARPDLLAGVLGRVEVAYQNLESVELGVTTVDHYFDTLGGISRAVKRARGTEAAVYIGDQTRGAAKVRTLREQVALETRSRALNPRFFEPLLEHGHEGVRAIEAHVTNTMGWSATTGEVEPWVYQRLSETYLLDDAMRERLAALNPVAAGRMANRLLEASDREYWAPDADTLAALQGAADALEDRLEGIA
ncbi:cobaltochelatase subunit CobN [Hasllibacter halocynthiae]|uniref:cobaltochelatase subunit CobN n=1 Tax=Hasllibacter halocynthiae TaxID=595589 RepID=UPI000D06583B